jgi:hypothetical protein
MALRRGICMPSWLLWRLIVGFPHAEVFSRFGAVFIGRGRGGLGAFGVKGAFLRAHVLGEAWYCVYGDRPYANIHHSLRSENYGCIQPQVFQLLLPLCNANERVECRKDDLS